MVHIHSLVVKKMQFNSLWEFVLPWQSNQEADHHNCKYFELSLPEQHLCKNRVMLHQWFWRSRHLENSFFLNLISLWQPNKMATDHETHTLDRESSNDRNCHIWFTSLHWLWSKYNLTIFHYKFMGAFCCHGNQTKRQITVILAILNWPYQSNICTKLEL